MGSLNRDNASRPRNQCPEAPLVLFSRPDAHPPAESACGGRVPLVCRWPRRLRPWRRGGRRQFPADGPPRPRSRGRGWGRCISRRRAAPRGQDPAAGRRVDRDPRQHRSARPGHPDRHRRVRRRRADAALVQAERELRGAPGRRRSLGDVSPARARAAPRPREDLEPTDREAEAAAADPAPALRRAPARRGCSSGGHRLACTLTKPRGPGASRRSC